MRPIWIILYAVVVTLLLTLFLPRLQKTSPKFAWLLLAAGILGVVVLVIVVLTR